MTQQESIEGGEIRIRGDRQPGHCWQDNELYACFGPVIGIDAVAVYGQLSMREESGRVSFSLRDIGRWLGKSKDTIQRALAVLELVGLVRGEGADRRGMRIYALVNLKDLAERYGGTYRRKERSYLLPEAKVAELQGQVAGLKRKLARLGKRTVANSDSGAFSRPPLLATVASLGSDSIVANSDSHQFIEDKDKENLPQPPPAAPEGAALPEIPLTAEQQAHLDSLVDLPGAMSRAKWEAFYREENRMAAQAASEEVAKAWARERRERELKRAMPNVRAAREWLFAECGWLERGERSGRGLESIATGVLRSELKAGKPLWETAPAIASSWKLQAAEAPRLRVRYGPENFLRKGVWRDTRTWHWKS